MPALCYPAALSLTATAICTSDMACLHTVPVVPRRRSSSGQGFKMLPVPVNAGQLITLICVNHVASPIQGLIKPLELPFHSTASQQLATALCVLL